MEYRDEDREKRRERRKKRLLAKKVWYHRMITRIFIILIIVFFLANLFTRDREFSDQENRNLAQRPKLTLTALADGSYFQDLGTYQADQFVGRDGWISFRSGLLRLIGEKESGDVYFGKHGYLLEKAVEPDEEAVQNTEKAMQDFAAQNSTLQMNAMLVPCAGAVQKQYLPSHAPMADQLSDIDEVEAKLSTSMKVLDVSSVLQNHSTEYIYYKTDHHWTSKGAYYAFVTMAEGMNLTSVSESYDVHTISNSFQGTLASKSGCHTSKDDIEIYQPRGVENTYYVYYPDSGEKKPSVYEPDKLKEKDQYTVFTGGNHALVQIQSTNLNSRNLLILKDSYANSFVQFLTPYFEKIDIVDPRYYYDNLATLIEQDNITDVLFLYSMNTFAEDTSLADVLNACVTSQKEKASAGTESDASDGTEGTTADTDSTGTQSDANSSTDTGAAGTDADDTQNGGTAQQTGNTDSETNTDTGDTDAAKTDTQSAASGDGGA